jgi:DeoR/GlpR family transcriptional regulator of sugar metabolism
MRILEMMRSSRDGLDLEKAARELGADARTIRRDVSYLQDVMNAVHGVEIRRGKLHGVRPSHSTGYFADHLDEHRAEKLAIANRVVDYLTDDLAIAITAGSTTYYVAREIRQRVVEDIAIRNLIAFTNSLPALMELVSAGVSTGVLGEVFNEDDSAFHAHTLEGAYQPGLVIVGASGVALHPALELSSHRAEEAAFLKQLLARAPEIWVAVDATKLGRRHPWSFTSGGALDGKSVRVFTTTLDTATRDKFEKAILAARKVGTELKLEECSSEQAAS